MLPITALAGRKNSLHLRGLDTWHNACDEPARQAHLDNGDRRRIHVEGRHGSAQVVSLACCNFRMGLHRSVHFRVAARPIGFAQQRWLLTSSSCHGSGG